MSKGFQRMIEVIGVIAILNRGKGVLLWRERSGVCVLKCEIRVRIRRRMRRIMRRRLIKVPQ